MMVLEPITRAEQIMSGESLTPITREEMFLAKAAGQDVQTPTPITRREKFLSKISANSGGGDTGGGKFKKKFMSFMCVRSASASATYDFVATLGSAVTHGSVCSYDEEILPTKTYDGIKVSGEALHFYFIEDENDVFVYGDMMGTGTAEWISVSMLFETEFGGVITDANQLVETQLTPNVPYAFFYYVEAE